MKKKKSLSDEEFLLYDIGYTRFLIKCAYNKLSQAGEPELVDEAVYELKSLEAKYGYLLKKYKGEMKK